MVFLSPFPFCDGTAAAAAAEISPARINAEKRNDPVSAECTDFCCSFCTIPRPPDAAMDIISGKNAALSFFSSLPPDNSPSLFENTARAVEQETEAVSKSIVKPFITHFPLLFRQEYRSIFFLVSSSTRLKRLPSFGVLK